MFLVKIVAIVTLVQLCPLAAQCHGGVCDLDDSSSLLQVKQDIKTGAKQSEEKSLLQEKQSMLPPQPMAASVMPAVQAAMPIMPNVQQVPREQVIESMPPPGAALNSVASTAEVYPYPGSSMGGATLSAGPSIAASMPMGASLGAGASMPLGASQQLGASMGAAAQMPLNSAGSKAQIYPYTGAGYISGVHAQISRIGSGSYYGGYGPRMIGGYGGGYGRGYYGGGYGMGYGGYGMPMAYDAMPYQMAAPVIGGYGQNLYPTYSSPCVDCIGGGGYAMHSGVYGAAYPPPLGYMFSEESAKPTEVTVPAATQP